MRRFIIVLPLLALSKAATLGYNYASITTDPANSNRASAYASTSNVEISKEIFSFSPSTDLSEDVSQPSQLSAATKKHLKVIFIRSPEYPDLTKALANLVQNNLQQKTVIYVLKKQTDLSELAHKIQQIKQENLIKPEVHFVKYKNGEEAEKAVRTIQNHYESLGGKTWIGGSSLAPVLNFSSKHET